jgi:hypothetical protein
MRRTVVFALGFLAALWALTGPVAACDQSHTGTDWACLYVEHLDTGLCQQNPLPQELSVPEELQVVPDEVPELAPLAEGVIQLIPDIKPHVPSIGSVLSNPTSVVPGGNPVPVPGNPTAPAPGAPSLPSVPTAPTAPDMPYVPTGLPGTLI